MLYVHSWTPAFCTGIGEDGFNQPSINRRAVAGKMCSLANTYLGIIPSLATKCTFTVYLLHENKHTKPAGEHRSTHAYNITDKFKTWWTMFLYVVLLSLSTVMLLHFILAVFNIHVPSSTLPAWSLLQISQCTDKTLTHLWIAKCMGALWHFMPLYMISVYSLWHRSQAHTRWCWSIFFYTA